MAARPAPGVNGACCGGGRARDDNGRGGRPGAVGVGGHGPGQKRPGRGRGAPGGRGLRGERQARLQGRVLHREGREGLASVHDVDEPLPGLGCGAFRRRFGGAHGAFLPVRGQGAHELRRVLGVVGRRRTAAAAGGQLGAGARGHGTDGSGPQASFARLSRGHRARHLAARRRRPRRAANPAQALSSGPHPVRRRSRGGPRGGRRARGRSGQGGLCRR